MRLALIVALTTVACGGDTTVAADIDRVLSDRSPTLMLEYFQGLAASATEQHQSPSSLEAWRNRRVELRRELWSSVGRFPLENRPPLCPSVVGRIDHDDCVVEKIVYQSLPGLYVTALMYLPKNPSRAGRHQTEPVGTTAQSDSKLTRGSLWETGSGRSLSQWPLVGSQGQRGNPKAMLAVGEDGSRRLLPRRHRHGANGRAPWGYPIADTTATIAARRHASPIAP